MAPTRRCGWARQPLQNWSPSTCKMMFRALLTPDGSGGSAGSGAGGPPRGGPPVRRHPQLWPPQKRRSLPPPLPQRLPPLQLPPPCLTSQGRAGGPLDREALWQAATPLRPRVRRRLPHHVPRAQGTRGAPSERPHAAPAERPPLPTMAARPHWWRQQQSREGGRPTLAQQGERRGWRQDQRRPVHQRHVRQPPPA